jgi:DNA topoisomerase-1
VGALGVDVFNSFEPIYVPLPDKEDIISRLAKRSTECSRILLASDEDREGEAISWHLMELLQPAVPVKRAVFHEITKSAIENSFASPRYVLHTVPRQLANLTSPELTSHVCSRDIDMNLVQSQETRRILDRLAGFTLSPLLWRYIAYGLSAGRVQSCGLYHIAKVA